MPTPPINAMESFYLTLSGRQMAARQCQWVFCHLTTSPEFKMKKKGKGAKGRDTHIVTDSKWHKGKPPFKIVIKAPQTQHYSDFLLVTVFLTHTKTLFRKHTQTHMVVLARSQLSVRRICGSEMGDQHHHWSTSWSHWLPTIFNHIQRGTPQNNTHKHTLQYLLSIHFRSAVHMKEKRAFEKKKNWNKKGGRRKKTGQDEKKIR